MVLLATANVQNPNLKLHVEAKDASQLSDSDSGRCRLQATEARANTESLGFPLLKVWIQRRSTGIKKTQTVAKTCHLVITNTSLKPHHHVRDLEENQRASVCNPIRLLSVATLVESCASRC